MQFLDSCDINWPGIRLLYRDFKLLCCCPEEYMVRWLFLRSVAEIESFNAFSLLSSLCMYAT